MSNEFIIGSHVSFCKPDLLLGCVKDALAYEANTFMYYLGAPTSTKRNDSATFKVKEAIELMQEHKMYEPIIHAPYIVNIASSNPETSRYSVEFLKEEFQRASESYGRVVVLHPGNHLEATISQGIENIITNLDKIFLENNSRIIVALETMSGKGTEIGYKLEQLATIINNSKFPEKLGICLDTCHLHDAGYDLNKFDEILLEIDQLIGLDKVLAVHLNNSKNIQGAKKDRHANLDAGCIDFDTLAKIAHHPLLKSVPKILETPYIDDKPPYKEEIALLRQYSS